MKIYCSRLDRNSFDYYVGKDIWVLVNYKSPEAILQHKYWVRILRYVREFNNYNPKGYYEVHCVSWNEISSSTDDYDGTLHCSEDRKKYILNKVKHMSADKYEISIPLDTRTTDELFTIIN